MENFNFITVGLAWLGTLAGLGFVTLAMSTKKSRLTIFLAVVFSFASTFLFLAGVNLFFVWSGFGFGELAEAAAQSDSNPRGELLILAFPFVLMAFGGYATYQFISIIVVEFRILSQRT